MSIKEVSPSVFVSQHSVAKFSRSDQFGIPNYPTNVVLQESNVETSTIKKHKIVNWGQGNNQGEKTLNLIKQIGVAGKVVQVATAAHFGTGLVLYEEDELGKKKEIPFRLRKGVADFDKKNNFDLFYLEAINDLEIHDFVPVEFLLSADFKTINRIKRHQPVHFRFCTMNERNGRIEYAALCGDWSAPTEDSVNILPCFSQYDYFEDIKAYCRQKKIHNFIIVFHYVKNGEVYYNQPFWHAPLNNGWADIILSVPEVKNIISAQQLQIKYLIHISEEYFQRAYGPNANGGWNWDEFTADQQKEKKEALQTAIDEHLSGKKATGRSMTVPMFVRPDGSFVKSIEIQPIDDKLKDGAYLPDASAGNYEIAFAKGVDPSIIGAGIPGGSNLSGSGSDKREAYTILCANMVVNRTISLLPFYLIRDWNGWGDDLYAGFPNVVLTTLDKETSGQKKVIN